MIEYLYLGRLGYDDALRLQAEIASLRLEGLIENTLLLLEHPPVLTLGRNASRANVLASDELLAERGVALHEINRGGDVTYHGPGQLVSYPILDLRPDRQDVHRYVRDLEEVMIRLSADYGLPAARIAGLSGTWIGDGKIGAVGIRISRWITSHGIAFNVNTDLSYFDLIVPCGIADKSVTSLERELGREVAMSEVEDRFAERFAEVFEREVAVAAGQ